jgi:hypothetical protein
MGLAAQYSSRQLTHPTDKMVAFSAIAATFAKVNGFSEHDYLAGH